MSQRTRIATSLLSVGAIAVIGALLVIGAIRNAASSARCGAATDRTYLATRVGVARWIAIGERIGRGVKQAVRTVESDRVLAAAVASGDLAGVHSEVVVLVYNHEHIVRLRVLRGGQVLDDLGGPLVLQPVRGTLRAGGRVVGTFVLSVQDDAGYRKLAQRLDGTDTVIRYRGRTIMSDVAVGGVRLPVSGAVSVNGARYLVATLSAGRFPVGTLRISLLVAAPPAALARSSCAQVRADVLADVARRAYDESRSGPPIVPAVTTIAGDRALPQALDAGDYAGAAKILAGMVRGGGFARLRVFVGGRLVAEAGSQVPALVPLSRPVIDAAGRVVGRAVFAVDSAKGYTDLARALTRVPVLVRAGARQLAGSFPGPRRLPRSGPLRYRGVDYTVASFTGVAFPSGQVRIYVLAPG